jgi:myo-inositol-1(or 4)-monophosphatase
MQLDRVGSDLRVTEKSQANIVTEVDLAVETMFRERVAAAFPDHGVMGEEFAEARPGGSGPVRRWLFDPIDGTANYAHGLPFFCASLAFEVDGVVEIAAIYEPTRRELFTAVRGAGAALNDQAIRVSTTARLADALVATGFPHNATSRATGAERAIGEFAVQSRGVRRLGSAALDLCYVACARTDAFYDANLKPWDTAAGALIVAEAGGRVTGLDAAPFSNYRGGVLASNGRIHESVAAITAAI